MAEWDSAATLPEGAPGNGMTTPALPAAKGPLSLDALAANPTFASDTLSLRFWDMKFAGGPESDVNSLRISFRTSIVTAVVPLTGQVSFSLDVGFSAIVYDSVCLELLRSSMFSSEVLACARVQLRSLALEGSSCVRTLQFLAPGLEVAADGTAPPGRPVATMEMHLALLFTGRCGESKPPVHPFHLLAHMGSTELQLLGELTGEPKKTVIVAKGDLGDMETVATQRRTKAPARLVFTTERNRLGLAEANGTLASVFRDGFEPRNLFSTLALIIGQLYARVDRPITRKTAAVTPDMLREAMHYHRWSTAPYGSLLLAHQTGRNWLQDCYRFGSDELAAAEFLGLADNDMLLFHRDSNNFYDPTYLIALDRITGMLVLSARGTLDVMSGLTDLASDVCLFRDGAAHLGWLRSSMLVYNRELARVLRWVEAYRPRGLVVCGHSYGAAVASLLCILFTDHVEELRALSGRVDFDVRAFTYGCPPTVSPAIAAQFVGAIHSYQHENDNVCSLSMGALYDMRDLVALADSHLARGTPKEETLRDLERLRRSLLETGRYPRLEVPGRVVYLYQDPGKPLHNRLEDRSYLAEESLASCFHELIPKALVEPHFPRSYAAALAKALEAAEGTGYGTGGRKSRTTREWWRDPYEDRLKVMRQVERMEVPAAGKIDPATGLCDCTGCIKDRERA